MPIYKQTTEITKIDDVWANIDRDIVEVYFGDKNIFTVWGEYDGTLPITINANGDALIDYRIYGASGGVGEPTENLFDPNAKSVDNGYINNSAIGYPDGEMYNIGWAYVTEYIPVDGNTNYIIFTNLYRGSVDYVIGLAFYDENKNFISAIKGYIALAEVTYENPKGGMKSFTTPENCKYIRTNVDKIATMLMLVAASTPPPSYIPYGYKLPMTVQSANLFDKNATNTDNGFVAHAYVNNMNIVMDYYNFNVSEYIPVKPNTAYYAQDVSYTSVAYCSVCFYTADHTFISAISYSFRINIPFTTPANTAYVRMSVRIINLDIITLTEGTEPPSEYIPYNKQTIPVYIGENQLDAGEYVSFSEQKIYRDVNGTLTPTDPPVPFPEIPTIDGTTIIDYDGDPKPSQMYIKYRKQHS